ncbi:MAG: MmcQ-like protein [Bacteroidetes bacterium HGW-Bacteroidetes-2]|jgi:predicted DNA-binding protein (MmcQ/YjbR family)|nr:MAG: MmcQ-like protein [Bacteroidetes bacterium HGW-Bacteroidetes-2]
MNIESYRNYCIAKKGVTEEFPFDKDTLVFKVMGKLFALTSLKDWEAGSPSINLKCNPEWSEELRAHYAAIYPGYHMSKKHWNTVVLNKDVSDKIILELIDHSYKLAASGLTKKLQNELKDL